jgi:hypothetical protein
MEALLNTLETFTEATGCKNTLLHEWIVEQDPKNDMTRLRRALGHARVAHWHAEIAYSTPTMASLLYFPDDHKFAVLLPLLAPLAMPIFLNLFAQVKNN